MFADVRWVGFLPPTLEMGALRNGSRRVLKVGALQESARRQGLLIVQKKGERKAWRKRVD
jgi:hypothetical protein